MRLTTLAGESQHHTDQFNSLGYALQLTDKSYKRIDIFLDAAETVKSERWVDKHFPDKRTDIDGLTLCQASSG